MPAQPSPLSGGNSRSSSSAPASPHAAATNKGAVGSTTPDRRRWTRFFPLHGSPAADTTSTIHQSSSSRSSVIRSSLAKALGSCFAPSIDKHHHNHIVDYSKSSSRSAATTVPSSSSWWRAGSSRSSSHGRGRTRSDSRRDDQGESRNSRGKIAVGSTKLSMADILRATNNFSSALKIGQGGFGTVYRGTLNDGSQVAVKRAKKSVYDTHLGAEFKTEIETMARVEHLNLVRLLGFLDCDQERIVVVEYVPNGTLRQHLDGLRGGGSLDLPARLDIAIDVAHAVTYLHLYTDRPIIHRDIKSSNILITDNLRAKVADFGFARLGAALDTGATHVSTQVKGTAGYLDPEYLRTYQLTDKSDVYSFGVLLVELMSGRRPIEPKRQLQERITAKWAMKKFMDGKAVEVLDPALLPCNPATNLALEKVLELALQCLAPTKQGRPSMRRCAEILWSVRKDYRDLLASAQGLII